MDYATLNRIGILSLTLITLLAGTGRAETGQTSQADAPLFPRASHAAVGLELSSLGGDFGVGFNLTSPYFIARHWALRASLSRAGREAAPIGQADQANLGYTVARFGLIGSTLPLSNLVSLYGGGGVVGSFPSAALGGESAWGGYGSFGFEFLLGPAAANSFFLELGGSAGGRAENVLGRPTYGAGFLASVGSRHYF